MAPSNRNQISLYEEAIAGIRSLAKQTTFVFVSLLIMLVLTGGAPSGFVMSLSFFLGVVSVAFLEKQRVTNLKGKSASITDSRSSIQSVDISEDYGTVTKSNESVLIGDGERQLIFSGSGRLPRFVEKDADLSFADLGGRDLSSEDLSAINLSYANLNGAILGGSVLTRTNLSNAQMRGASLVSAVLSKANLSRANLRGAELINAILIGANLSNADLSGANLSEANLREANLSNTDLSGANLNEANLKEANLSNANLTRTDVKSAQFQKSLGISNEMKLDLIQRGAVFEDSPGNRSN
jgi:uncharacterized protein YjbI with pentapeptide repeats